MIVSSFYLEWGGRLKLWLLGAIYFSNIEVRLLSLARGWRMGFYIIRRWTIEQPLALWTYDDEFISSQMSFDDEPVRLMCSLLLPSEGVPVCCDCCASLYTSHTASILLTLLRCYALKLFLSSIELLTLTCASVFVFCVLLSLCLVCFCLCVLCASA